MDLSEFKTRRAKPCAMARAVTVLSEADQEKFQAAIKETDILTAEIHRWLVSKGVSTPATTLRLHRTGECCCG